MNTQTSTNNLKAEQVQIIAETAESTEREITKPIDHRSRYGRFAFSSVLGE